MIDHIKQWYLVHAAWIGGLVYTLLPQVRDYVCSHPKITAGSFAAWVLAALLKQSPAVKVAVFLLLFSSVASAQAPPAPPAPNDDVNVTVTTEYIHFTNGASGTMIEATRPITNYWSLGYAQIVVPTAKSNFYLLGPRYDTDLQHIFKNSHPAKLNLSLIKFFTGGGLGTRRDDLGNQPTFAYGFHAGFGIPVGTLMKANIAFNVQAGLIGAAKQAVNGPKVLFSFTDVVSGNYAAGVTFKF
jgi:hypothetical protein